MNKVGRKGVVQDNQHACIDGTPIHPQSLLFLGFKLNLLGKFFLRGLVLPLSIPMKLYLGKGEEKE